jgi:hypothetical protein
MSYAIHIILCYIITHCFYLYMVAHNISSVKERFWFAIQKSFIFFQYFSSFLNNYNIFTSYLTIHNILNIYMFYIKHLVNINIFFFFITFNFYIIFLNSKTEYNLVITLVSDLQFFFLNMQNFYNVIYLTY